MSGERIWVFYCLQLIKASGSACLTTCHVCRVTQHLLCSIKGFFTEILTVCRYRTRSTTWSQTTINTCMYPSSLDSLLLCVCLVVGGSRILTLTTCKGHASHYSTTPSDMSASKWQLYTAAGRLPLSTNKSKLDFTQTETTIWWGRNTDFWEMDYTLMFGCYQGFHNPIILVWIKMCHMNNIE